MATAAMASKLGAGEHLAGRVVGRVEQQQPGAGRDGAAQLVEVEVEGRRPQRHGTPHRSGHGDARRVRVVVGLERHHLVARLEQRQHCGRDGLGGAGRDEHLGVGIVVEAVEPALVLGDGQAQLGDAGAGRVLVVAVPDRLDGGVEDLGGAVGVREALPEVDRAGGQGQRRHLGEDRGAEALEPAREQWPPHACSLPVLTAESHDQAADFGMRTTSGKEAADPLDGRPRDGRHPNGGAGP